MHGTQNILEKHITEICSECCCLGSTASNDGLWNREIGKQIKKNGMTFGRLKSKMRTELHLVHNKPTLYRPGVPYFLFSFTTCLFNFFFSFTLPTTRQNKNHPQILQPWSKSICNSAPWGWNGMEDRYNNSNVAETCFEIFSNILMPCNPSFFLPTHVSPDKHFSIQHLQPGERDGTAKMLGERKTRCLTWEFQIWNSQLSLKAKTFAFQGFSRKQLSQWIKGKIGRRGE
jgi:hypothetical protein